jgi:hypothetical protein
MKAKIIDTGVGIAWQTVGEPKLQGRVTWNPIQKQWAAQRPSKGWPGGVRDAVLAAMAEAARTGKLPKKPVSLG